MRDFEQFRDLVDECFEEMCGDDVQGMIIQAARANQTVSDEFSELVEQSPSLDKPALRVQHRMFENFR